MGVVLMKFGLDGVQRDIVKMWHEGGIVARQTWPHIKRVFTDFDGHAVQNVFVETLRASPYFWGHVWAVWIICNLVILFWPVR
jgi:hypothetical protein